jgi:hypothetical protein
MVSCQATTIQRPSITAGVAASHARWPAVAGSVICQREAPSAS